MSKGANRGWMLLLNVAGILTSLMGCGPSRIEELQAQVERQQQSLEAYERQVDANKETIKNLRENFEALGEAVDQIHGTFIGVKASAKVANTTAKAFEFDEWRLVVPRVTIQIELMQDDVKKTEQAIMKARHVAGLDNLMFDPGRRQ